MRHGLFAIETANAKAWAAFDGAMLAQEKVTELLRDLAQDADNRGAIAKAGAIPELVRQLENGTLNARSQRQRTPFARLGSCVKRAHA